MRYQHSREESAAILRRALQLMSPHRTGYHPVSYAVWYEHAAALNPGLTRELDELLAADALLSDAEICRLHARHIAGRDEQALELAPSQLGERLGESEKQAASAERTVKHCGASLGQALESLRGAEGERLLTATVVRVVAELSELRALLGALRQQLAGERREIELVMERLARAGTDPPRQPADHPLYDAGAAAAERIAITPERAADSSAAS